MAATEESVGISCYANDLPGIHGVLKQRFADFIVNEVAPDGTVVHLTHLHLSPALLAQEQQQQALARRREAESLGEVVDAGALVAQFRQALGGRGGAVGEREGGGGLRDEEDARKLQQLLEGIRGIQLWWRARKGGEEGGGGEGEGAGGGEGDGGDREEGSKQGGEGALGEGEAEGKGLPPAMPEPVVFAASADKAYRAAMHAFFKAFPFLVSDTIDAVEGPPYRCVRLRFLPPPALNLGGAAGRGAAGNGAQRDGADDRGGGEGEEEENEQPAFDRRGRKGADGVPATATRRFLMFHVLKENKDTNEAMALVARYLGVQTKALGFSGTKDKRAVTVQRVTVCNQTARKVASLNSKLFGIRVGDYRFVDQPLVLGQLAGNRFIVTLRSVQAPSLDAITAAAEGLRTHGIINYFGLQRFGVGPVATHAVGAALLRGDWQGAVDLILKPRDGDILAPPMPCSSHALLLPCPAPPMPCSSHALLLPCPAPPMPCSSHALLLPCPAPPMPCSSHALLLPCPAPPMPCSSHALLLPCPAPPMPCSSHTLLLPCPAPPMPCSSHALLLPCPAPPMPCSSHALLLPCLAPHMPCSSHALLLPCPAPPMPCSSHALLLPCLAPHMPCSSHACCAMAPCATLPFFHASLVRSGMAVLQM
ncbi:hypothetical protein CLOM_g14197 [Closterium sp. NIES-68]|nr:hypothetical protein CLOM_g14197 [Closterium sp. NIES-68]